MVGFAMSAGNGVLAAENLIDHVTPVTLWTFQVGGHAVNFTNHMFMAGVSALLMLLVFPIIARQAKSSPVPTGARNFFEAIMSFLRTEVFRPALGDQTDRFVPLLWTVFFFVLFCNLIGMIPIVPIIEIINGKTGKEIPLFGGTATANITVTAGLALLMFCAIHVSGIWQQIRIQMDPTLDPHYGNHHGEVRGGGQGAMAAEQHEETHEFSGGDATVYGHHAAHGKPRGKGVAAAIPMGVLIYIKNFVPAVPLYLWPLMFVLELIGAAVKPFALAVRLFANMMAGHLILAALIGVIPAGVGVSLALKAGIGIPVVLGSAALQILELFVAFLQAYIFTFLTTLFIASAVAPEH